MFCRTEEAHVFETAPLCRTPYFFIGARPVREARLASYILRQHHAARRLADVANDPYVRRCGASSLWWRVVMQPETIAALRRDLADSFAELRP
jgi:hypothetical protein